MSYNIQNGKGMDNVVDYRRIADVIVSLSPDVVALQELDSMTHRSHNVDVLARLASLTGMHAVFGASIHLSGGKYGIGVLSKEEPVSWKRIPLPGREEHRSLLVVEFEDYIFCCTHFSLHEHDRLASVHIIERTVADFDKPVILAGDLNATPDSPVIEAFRRNWVILTDTGQPTFPADKPDKTIDYILGYTAKGHTFTVLQTRTADEPIASDHRPVFVDTRVCFPACRLP